MTPPGGSDALVGGGTPRYNGPMSDAIRQWMEKYLTAWTTNEPDDIRALFTEDAVYATRPYDPDAWRGHGQIVEHWLTEADEPEEWTFEWSPLGSDGDLHFVQGRTTYLGDRPSYENLWVVRLAPDGRAAAFTEWFMERTV
jgi:SnoaL-like domain